MSSSSQPSNYTAYLLRCWQEGVSWRYSLEEIGSGKRHGFASLDEFVSFLLAMSMQPETSEKFGDDGETHMSARPRAFTSGLRWLFSG